MRVKITREIAVGLSVILVLTLVLTAAAAQRFLWHTTAPELVGAEKELRHVEEPNREEHRLKEAETHKPAIVSPLPEPVAESRREHNDLWKPEAHSEPHIEAHTEEHHEAKSAIGGASTIAAKPTSTPSITPHERQDEARHERQGYEDSVQPSADLDNRYAVPAVLPPGVVPPVASRGTVEPSPAAPMVIQVSGDAVESPPQRVDGRAHEMRSEPPRNESYAATVVQPELAEHRRTGLAEPPRNEPAAVPPSYAARDPRYAYNPTSAIPRENGRVENGPVENGPPAYPGPAAGYARDESPRRGEYQAPAAQNPLRNDGMYEVQPNDSYWTISERVYGTGGYFRALAEANRGKAARPDRLAPGLLISTPPVAQLEKDYPDFCPRPNRREAVRNRAAAASLASYSAGRTYVVQEGDSLTSIARNELGKISRWAEIYQLNREALGKDYDYLTPGMRLVLPPRESPAADRTARRTEEGQPFSR